MESKVLPRFQPGCMAATSAGAVGELGGVAALAAAGEFDIAGTTATARAATATVANLTRRYLDGRVCNVHLPVGRKRKDSRVEALRFNSAFNLP
jgi:hypothetical protein